MKIAQIHKKKFLSGIHKQDYTDSKYIATIPCTKCNGQPAQSPIDRVFNTMRDLSSWGLLFQRASIKFCTCLLIQDQGPWQGYRISDQLRELCRQCLFHIINNTDHVFRVCKLIQNHAQIIFITLNGIVTVCVFVRHLFSFYPFYFDFHSARIIFDVSSGFYLWNINKTTA